MHCQQSIITFYNELSSLVNDIPLREHILICGDINALLTADGCRVKNVCGKPNISSEALPAFITLHDLITANASCDKNESSCRLLMAQGVDACA